MTPGLQTLEISEGREFESLPKQYMLEAIILFFNFLFWRNLFGGGGKDSRTFRLGDCKIEMGFGMTNWVARAAQAPVRGERVDMTVSIVFGDSYAGIYVTCMSCVLLRSPLPCFQYSGVHRRLWKHCRAILRLNSSASSFSGPFEGGTKCRTRHLVCSGIQTGQKGRLGFNCV